MAGIALLFNPIIQVRFYRAGRKREVGND